MREGERERETDTRLREGERERETDTRMREEESEREREKKKMLCTWLPLYSVSCLPEGGKYPDHVTRGLSRTSLALHSKPEPPLPSVLHSVLYLRQIFAVLHTKP